MQQRYQIGGTLAVNAQTYVERQADQTLFEVLKGGDYAYVFNARQMGKSSLLVRTAHRLRVEGYRCALVDFSRIGSDQITPLQWYSSFVAEVYRSLRAPLVPALELCDRLAWPQQLTTVVEQGLLPLFPNDTIVVFLDEVDSVLHLPFGMDDFFAWVRACYNQRAAVPAYRRLSFALFGVTSPANLIQDARRTPFNIGQEIDLGGFALPEAMPLAAGLEAALQGHSPGVTAAALLSEILTWTAGQPLLTQKLCALVAEQLWAGKPVLVDGVAACVEGVARSRLIEGWQFKDTPVHFRAIRDQLLADPVWASRLLGRYRQALEGNLAADGAAEQTALLLSGLVVNHQGQLRVKNRIYRQIFDAVWVERELAQLRPYAPAFAAWTAAGEDSRHLLQGEALRRALLWAKDRHLSDADYRFLSASQAQAQQRTEQSLWVATQAQAAAELALIAAEQAHQRLNLARHQARQRPLPRPALWLAAVVLAVSGLVLALQLSGLLQFSEWMALDVMFQALPLPPPPPWVTLISISEDDIRSLGYPVPDTDLTEAIARLQQADVALIGLDIYRDLPVGSGRAQLNQVLANTPNLFGIYKQVPPAVPPPLALPPERLGFADQVLDSDGAVRRALLALQDGQKVTYGFALQLALAYLAPRGITPMAQNGYMQLGQARLYPFQANSGGYVRAEDGGYQILLNYYGPEAVFPSFSLRALLAGQIPPEALAHRIVLIGYRAESVNDLFQTPFSKRLFQPPQRMSGVALHGNILASILAAALEGRPLLRAWPNAIAQLWLLVWVGLGAAIGWRLQTPLRAAGAVLAALFGLWVFALEAFYLGWWVPVVPAALGLITAAALFPSLSDRARQRHRLQQTVVYFHRNTAGQPLLFSLGLSYLKQAEGQKFAALIDTTVQRLPPPNGWKAP